MSKYIFGLQMSDDWPKLMFFFCITCIMWKMSGELPGMNIMAKSSVLSFWGGPCLLAVMNVHALHKPRK